MLDLLSLSVLCPEDQYRCNNGDCVRGNSCDRRIDCVDRSDEWPSTCGECKMLNKQIKR